MANYALVNDAGQMFGAPLDFLDTRYMASGTAISNVGTVSPATRFGATGDGGTDDTAALQAWLSDPAPVKTLPPGTYRVSGELTCSVPNVTILGPGTIQSVGMNQTVLTVVGDGATVDGLHIDGTMVSRTGIRVDSPSHIVQNCLIENFRSTVYSTRGIDSTSTGMVIIRDNVLRMIDGPGNEQQGDSNGMVRAIVLHSLQDKVAPSLCTGNWIQNVTGEEADAIAVLYSDAVTSTDAYQRGWTRIAGNVIHNSTRRHIKIQGSDVWVDSNWCYNDPDLVQPNPSSVIDVVQGSRIRISNNIVKESGNTAPVSLTGPSSTERISDIEISGNRLAEGDGVSPVIYLVHADRVSITNNLLAGGSYYVSGGTSTDLLIAHNDMRGGSGDAFKFTSSALGRVRYNTVPTEQSLGTAPGLTFEGN